MLKFYKFSGIGEVSAAMAMASLAANPTLSPLASGFVGRIIFYFVKGLAMFCASLGLILLNVGAAKVETMIEEGNYNGTWDNAEATIKKIRDTGRELTPEEIIAIDDQVKEALRKFGRFGKTKSTKGKS